MLRRNRKVARGDDDEEAASPSPHKVSLLPTLQQHHKRRARRRKRRFNHDSTKILNLLGMIICVLLVLIIGHSAFTRKQTSRHPPNPMSQSHRHKRTTDDSSSSTNVQRPFNQTIDCPLEPIPGYPFEYNLVEMLEDWPIDDISLETPTSHASLCAFDWNHDVDREKMERYRKLELPFVIAGDPQVAEAADRWNQPGYLVNMLGADTKYSTDYSTTNHYIYVNQIQKARYKGSNQRLRKGKARQLDNGNDEYDDQAATNNTKIQMTYPEWLAIAQAHGKNASASDPRWYFQFMTCGTYEKGDCKSTSNGTISRLATLGTELPFLSDPESFYIVEPDQQKGRIQCKFGMAGITSQAHFDTPRNFLVLLGGKRRYVLLHPRNYANLYMFPGNHPSARHSAVNWSAPDLNKHPMFAKAKATEIVLQQGEVLYIPPKWIHSIVSLSTSMQCNAWSGAKNQEG